MYSITANSYFHIVKSYLVPFNPFSGLSLLTHRNDCEIQQIPDPPKVLEPVLPDLNDLLDDVIDDESNVDKLAGHDKVVHRVDIAEELHSVEIQFWENAASWGKLKEDPVKSYFDE